ncbi:MAG: UV-damage endonuclease [Watsoniomyces obsoletus]|nr:MAG: UV-damage endonuclease [Watsoniomyces obsoletus]
MAKRKRSTATSAQAAKETPVPLPPGVERPLRHTQEQQTTTRTRKASVVVKQEVTTEVTKTSRRGLRTAAASISVVNGGALENGDVASDSPWSDLSETEPPEITTGARRKASRAVKAKQEMAAQSTSTPRNQAKVKKEENADEAALRDPEADDGEDAASEEEEIKTALSRPPPVHSSYLPLPWKGRLGYACLNTYLRYANPPVFSSRTCRIASILERRHPLADASMPHHPTKNRPDREQTPDIGRGQTYVEELGLANARDIVKMLRWNHRYGIKFMRLSSEMFPFASHDQYGYKLAPFASEVLAEAGRVAAELGHRLTTHPGQFTQLGSPRKEVIEAAIRDLDHHSELLSLLKLPPPQNRDAVMILHMGGVFGDKEATLKRFRENYQRLSPDVKNRLVLENDDVSWSVHDLLPICEELSIPMVLDYHHHNIIHSDEVREGTLDIMSLYDRINATWTRKGITPKMHYSEPTPSAITGRQRRKHGARVATLPPCDPTMDLMIEAKDKEQAVFELMRTFKLPGWNTFSDIIPHVRVDENAPVKKARKKATPKKKKKKAAKVVGEEENGLVAGADPTSIGDDAPPPVIPDEELHMGGPDGRVYWPPGMEEWLRPPKRIVQKKNQPEVDQEEKVTLTKKRKMAIKQTEEVAMTASVKTGKATPVKAAGSRRKASIALPAPEEMDEESSEDMPHLSGKSTPERTNGPVGPRRPSARARRVNYAEHD